MINGNFNNTGHITAACVGGASLRPWGGCSTFQTRRQFSRAALSCLRNGRVSGCGFNAALRDALSSHQH